MTFWEDLLAAFGVVNERGCLCYCELVNANGCGDDLNEVGDHLQESVSIEL